MSWLQNSWMDNPTFLAEMAHFAWAYGILLTAALFSATRRQLVQLFLAFVAFAVLKEFWYDLAYEIPNDSLSGSALDFAIYMLGGVVALAVISWRRRIDARDELSRLREQQALFKSFLVMARDRSGAPYAKVQPRLYNEEP